VEKKDIIKQLRGMAAGNGASLRQAAADVERQMERMLGRIDAKSISRVYVLGCGSSYFGAINVEHAFEDLAGIPTKAVEGFEFAAYQNMDLVDKRSLVLGFSTSGITAALLDSFARCKPNGATTVAVTALEESPLGRAADEILLTGAVDETDVCRTKANTQATIAMYLMAISLGKARGCLTASRAAALTGEVDRCIDGIVEILAREQEIIDLTKEYAGCTACLVVGTGPNVGTAQAGALMISEMAWVHSWGDETENFLHGRFREVNQAEPLLLLAPDGAGSRRTLDFLTVSDYARGPTIVFTDKVTPGLKKLATHVVTMKGGISEIMTPILYLTPLHLYAYHIAVANGVNPNVRRYPGINPSVARYEGE
jgi:glucosamine 6-phosphate synthetase-like amidotransferase/phosphosugar isomerase protein